MYRLEKERSDTIEKMFYENDGPNILPKLLENQIYAYIELIKEVEKHTKEFKYPTSVAFKDDDNNTYYCINNPKENYYITLYPNPISKQPPKAYIHSYTRNDDENEGYRLDIETEEFIAKSGLSCFEDFLKIIRPCEAYINSVLAKMS
jgi:hypothetical protein